MKNSLSKLPNIKKCLLKIMKKKRKFIKVKILFFFIKIIVIFLCSFLLFFECDKKESLISTVSNFKLDLKNNTFAILRINYCPSCGLFYYYKAFLGCILKHLLNEEIPIIDMISYKNMYNENNQNLNKNPWEFFFSQIYGKNLYDVEKFEFNKKYYICDPKNPRPRKEIFFNQLAIKFWHNIAINFMQIKSTIINESNYIIKKLFRGNKNVLGILMRGTDYVAAKPKNHPIPPKIETVINDINEMHKLNNYKYFFLSTEDDVIRNKFIKEYGEKLKYLKYKEDLNYNYKKKKYLFQNNSIPGNLDFTKIYLINMIILSKCIDFIAARTNGSLAVLIFTEGFRYTKIYNLGNY